MAKSRGRACTAIFYSATLFALSEFLAHSIGRRSASILNPGKGTTGFSGRRLMLLRNGSLLEGTGIRTPGPPTRRIDAFRRSGCEKVARAPLALTERPGSDRL